jgi:hypothetical protein
MTTQDHVAKRYRMVFCCDALLDDDIIMVGALGKPVIIFGNPGVTNDY